MGKSNFKGWYRFLKTVLSNGNEMLLIEKNNISRGGLTKLVTLNKLKPTTV